MTTGIRAFTGNNRWLSNFHPQAILFRDVLYPTAEHAYQDGKTRDPVTWRVIDPDAHELIMADTNPGHAKKAGRTARVDKKDWDARKLDIMLQILRVKFAAGTALAQRLLATNDLELVEGNFHGDIFWGVFRGKGFNHLGRLLMQIRQELRGGMFSVTS